MKTTFTLDADIKSASLSLSCDNSAKVLINGKKVGESASWNEPIVGGNVMAALKGGPNELVVEGANEDGIAAMVARMDIVFSSGKKQAVETDATWVGAPAGSTDFKPVAVIQKYGDGPWGRIFDGGKAGKGGAVSAADALNLPKDFKAELLYTVPKSDQGSWVTITVDPKGRLIACDQYGKLYRITVPAIGVADAAAATKVEELVVPNGPDNKPIGGAHGLLYAFDSLYVMINEQGGKGLWRLKDTDNDDKFDKAEHLRKIDGGGEHGPHGIILSPDKKSLYFSNGNHTKLPESMEISRAATAWGEDHVLPRLWDGNGHAKGILAPGGYICKTDPEGKKVELLSYGFRNEYDIALDMNGEIFTYDSDMEWDIGSPWYRPTRIAHATSGSDNGWRSGAGKWPEFYPDSLPTTLDIGPGSPTGVTFGTGAKFPAKYQRAFFACDWTYGTMYAIHLTPSGGSFKAVKEEFVSGKPLPLTDAIIHPKDGAMYFTIGGRKSQSALYRVTYVGQESTAPAPAYTPTPESQLRRQLEALHEEGTGAEAIAKAWPYLGHADRRVRFAARVAIERQPVAQWAEKALAETAPQASIEALVALSRMGRSPAAVAAAAKQQEKKDASSGAVFAVGEKDVPLQGKLFAALGRLDFAKLPMEQQHGVVRAYQLAITRLGKPGADAAASIAAKFDPFFPTKDALLNRELLQLLVVVDSKSIVAKTVPLLSTTADAGGAIATDELLARNDGYASAARAMAASRPNRQAITYAASLRAATTGWTPALRKQFYSWFPIAKSWKGGNSFPKFLENIRNESLLNVPEAERAAMKEISDTKAATPAGVTIAAKGPGRAWTVDEVEKLVAGGLKGRDFANGKAMYAATLCAACHKFAGDGGNIGPDLTGAGNRYTIRDLAENIIDPSKVISDQYGTDYIDLKDGGVVIGRVTGEENGKLMVMASPLAPSDLTAVPLADIKGRKPWTVSMMPPGLINSLNEDELKNLVAYLLSGGNEKDKAFAK
jgi:putative heme-binding domain-containing protein